MPRKEFDIKEVISVYDGDTFKAVIDLGFYTYLVKTFRLKRVNTPEIRSKSEEAFRMKEFLSKTLSEAAAIKIETTKSSKGKYGRQTCELFVKPAGKRTWDNVNDMIIEEGYPNVKRGSKST